MKTGLRLFEAAMSLSVVLAGTQAEAAYTNTTAGGALRPGVYGRIEVGKKSPPPPVIYSQPVTASGSAGPARGKPVFLYVPPGQVRKWSRYCGKYHACELPVYFIRMDNSPSKLGKWKSRGEAGERIAARVAAQSLSGPPGFRDLKGQAASTSP